MMTKSSEEKLRQLFERIACMLATEKTTDVDIQKFVEKMMIKSAESGR